MIQPGRTVIQPGRTVVQPGRTVVQAGRTVIQPGRTVIQAGRTVTHVRTAWDAPCSEADAVRLAAEGLSDIIPRAHEQTRSRPEGEMCTAAGARLR